MANQMTPQRLGLELAISAIGSPSRLADALGVSRQAIANWRQRGAIPATRVLEVERACSGRVNRYQMRPDVFGSEPEPKRRKRRA